MVSVGGVNKCTTNNKSLPPRLICTTPIVSQVAQVEVERWHWHVTFLVDLPVVIKVSFISLLTSAPRSLTETYRRQSCRRTDCLLCSSVNNVDAPLISMEGRGAERGYSVHLKATLALIHMREAYQEETIVLFAQLTDARQRLEYSCTRLAVAHEQKFWFVLGKALADVFQCERFTRWLNNRCNVGAHSFGKICCPLAPDAVLADEHFCVGFNHVDHGTFHAGVTWRERGERL